MQRINLTLPEELVGKAREVTEDLIGPAFASLMTPAQLVRTALSVYTYSGHRPDPELALRAARDAILTPGRRAR